jgi:DNA modification methylase
MHLEIGPHTIHHGDSRDVLATVPDNSISACVCDPPYALVSIVKRFGQPGAVPAKGNDAYARASAGFMGQSWDTGEVAFATEFWAQVLRVLKPGGHVVAFSGTRTYHRLAVAIEDSGFEIRDQLAWVYGSGFPKSHDVSKAIDKMDATVARRERQLRFTEWMRSTGLTSARIDALTGTNMGGHYTTAASQPAVATREHFETLRPHILVEVPDWVEQMVDERTVESENFKNREVVGTAKGAGTKDPTSFGNGHNSEFNITTALTPQAQQWEGWGTALKPAWEPIVLARKPLIGTVAANVLEHGTGAINIDGCRVATSEGLKGGAGQLWSHARDGKVGEAKPPSDLGRFPANILHDGEQFGENGRYFYSPKASKKDRGEGNTHPTVKPTDLMAYLCRLVTPPGGVVLDPFMGSGSTGKGAHVEGFRFIGIEREENFFEIAAARLMDLT